MKVRRDALVERYRRHKAELGGGSAAAQQKGAAGVMLRLWQDALDLSREPELGSDFFELGGDSLGAARLLAAAEQTFSAQVDIDVFFSDPTPRHLLALVGGATGPARTGGRSKKRQQSRAREVLDGVALEMADWKGKRVASHSLVVGLNVDGTKPPLFWIFQGYNNVPVLAKALGPDQPLYALRSGRGVVRTVDYSEQTLRLLVDKYFVDILAVARHRPFSLGGSCQGGMIAVLLAKRFAAIGREPTNLFLADWHRDFVRYDRPVQVLLSARSPMWSATPLSALEAHQRKLFPRATVRLLQIDHGQSVRPPSIHHLIAALEPSLNPSRLDRAIAYLKSVGRRIRLKVFG